MIECIRLGFVNVFLIKGEEGYVLVDTGVKGNGERIINAMGTKGIGPEEVKIIILTHGHSDHIGGLDELLAATGAKWIISRREYEVLQGAYEPMKGTNPFSKAMMKIVGRIEEKAKEATFPEPDILVDDHYDLNHLGFDMELYLTPGHSSGSLSVLTGEGDALIGDSLMAFLPWQGPGKPFIAVDLKQVHDSMQMLMDQGAKQFWLSHGNCYERARIMGALEKLVK